MQKHIKLDTVKIKLCTHCFNCKTKDGKVYCKLGVWKEKDANKTILHTPFDFNCKKWDDI